MLNRFRWTFATLLALALFGTMRAQEKTPAQTSGPPRGELRQRTLGTVTSVGVDRFEIKKMDGTTLTVFVNDQTRYREQQGELHLEDLKAGDHVGVRGEPNADKQFVAAGVMRLTDEQFQRFQAGGGQGPGGPGGGGWGGPGGGPRAGGEIIAIDQNRITVRNPRQGQMVIVVNEQTTFRKEGQAITLKDLKVGDRIFALGKEQDGQLVATQVRAGRLGMGRDHQGPRPGEAGGPPPGEPQSPPPQPQQ